jgi:5-methylthioadenosine/S-adenosylhomocysteine deaminase
MSALLLNNALVVTMDERRRILPGASVFVEAGRIVEIAPPDEMLRRRGDCRRIDCAGKALLPGLVDLHGYFGGSILKSAGEDLDGAARRNLLENVLSKYVDEEWWEVECRLSALERLKLGTTCMFSMLGGNGTRTDDPIYADIARREMERIGLRTRIGLGPARPPWPRPYNYWSGEEPVERLVSFEHVMDVCDQILSEADRRPSTLVDYCVALSRIGNENEHDPVWTPERQVWVGRQAEAAVALMRKHDVGFWTHMYGNSIEYAFDHDLGLLGPRSLLSHCTGVSQRSIDIMRETGSSCAHHPRAARLYSYPGRCPLPELIEAGVTVGLGADAPQNHDCDLFLDMKAAMQAQRMHFKDPRLMPVGKALEMATIDGCRALQLDAEIGAVAVGKKADLITVDLAQPHLSPIDMPVHRLVYNATGRDVSDVIVDGRVVMEDRRVLTINEEETLANAQQMYARVMRRAGLPLDMTNCLWGAARS